MEKQILDVVKLFASWGQRIESQKEGTALRIELSLEMPSSYRKDEPPKVKLAAHFYNGNVHESCEAASLDKLMDEVHRRCHLSDKESAKMEQIERSLLALPAPSDEIPF